MLEVRSEVTLSTMDSIFSMATSSLPPLCPVVLVSSSRSWSGHVSVWRRERVRKMGEVIQGDQDEMVDIIMSSCYIQVLP